MPEAIRRRTTLAASPATAFALFTSHLDLWWPPAFTWSQEGLQTIVIEPFVNGRCFERGPNGFTCDFGRVLFCEPGSSLRFTWQIDFTRVPQPDPTRASEVEVRFADAGGGTTHVEITHSAFERHGAHGEAYRAGMEQGWDVLVGALEAADVTKVNGPGRSVALRVCIDVPTLEQGISFYTGAFGFEVAQRFDAAAVLSGGPVPIDLLEKPAHSSASPAAASLERGYDRHWTPVHLDVPVPDAEAAVQRAKSFGAIQEREITTHPWGRLALMADPFGNGFCFLEFWRPYGAS